MLPYFRRAEHRVGSNVGAVYGTSGPQVISELRDPNPTTLAMTGYEQVRSVAAELAGDHEAAARVELTLPDTGVCGGSGLFDDPDQASSGGCCGPAPATATVTVGPQLVTIGAAPQSE